MSDRFSRLTAPQYLKWILKEEPAGTLFGIPRELFFTPSARDPFRMSRYGQVLETPIGVAAGPQTQLAHNIVVAWLCGARYIELKTVQTLDELEISKPCIDMEDEGYNCEWSQELRLEESIDEYRNAWLLIHLLRERFGWQTTSGAEGPGLIFNLSVGYNLEGILKPNVQRFFQAMDDSGEALRAKLDELAPLWPDARRLTVPARLSNSITLSTMHGCPPDEIGRIARYLMEERGLHTTVKLNPTLLGPAELRPLLNDTLGFPVSVPDAAFEHDLKWDDGVDLIRELRACGEASGVEFGLKLTNTLEVQNLRPVFPEKETMMYLSGRALHPLSLRVAHRLQRTFEGTLDISFSAGVDCFNAAGLLAAGLKPLTVCTDLLKPGGYPRLGQYLSEIRKEMDHVNAADLDQLILTRGGHPSSPERSALAVLAELDRDTPALKAYRKDSFPYHNIKTPRPLNAFDCVQAPCTECCAVGQDVPEYMYWAARGEMQRARHAILRENALPHITGKVCDHLCQSKCTRMNTDNVLLIREIKRAIAEHSQGLAGHAIQTRHDQRVAVIGAGPSGLSCAWFLALAGVQVSLYESKPMSGGMVSGAIPVFRMDETSLHADLDLIRQLGADLRLDQPVTGNDFAKIRAEHDLVYLGVGAQANKRLGLEHESAPGVMNQLHFLEDVRSGTLHELGSRVAVVGGGNSAMDVLRTARRLVGSAGEVLCLYRRSRADMPADRDEIAAAIAEGVTLVEMVAPVGIELKNGRFAALRCQRMQAGPPDSSGRPRPVPLPGSDFLIEADTLITAIGQDVVLDFFPEPALDTNPATGETCLPGVFAGGDAVRGASSLILAMGDGQRAARRMLERLGITPDARAEDPAREFSVSQAMGMLATRSFGPELPERPLSDRDNFELVHPGLSPEATRAEAARCLQCDLVCSVCTTVCPNMANLTYTLSGRRTWDFDLPLLTRAGTGVRTVGHERFVVSQHPQIINVADFCNECGNCTTFCPTSGDPWKDKPRLCLTEASLAQEENGVLLQGDLIRARGAKGESRLQRRKDRLEYTAPGVEASFDPENFTLLDAHLDCPEGAPVSLRRAAELWLLLEELSAHPAMNLEEPAP
ncbi:MAG: FAD-dependent oxidoreductase [Candidatus Delongbacteria bacterium]|nr:FAD-dependent oxidoreductase [Candidatus Delongbacteria bacterium]